MCAVHRASSRSTATTTHQHHFYRAGPRLGLPQANVAVPVVEDLRDLWKVSQLQAGVQGCVFVCGGGLGCNSGSLGHTATTPASDSDICVCVYVEGGGGGVGEGGEGFWLRVGGIGEGGRVGG